VFFGRNALPIHVFPALIFFFGGVWGGAYRSFFFGGYFFLDFSFLFSPVRCGVSVLAAFFFFSPLFVFFPFHPRVSTVFLPLTLPPHMLPTAYFFFLTDFFPPDDGTLS